MKPISTKSMLAALFLLFATSLGFGSVQTFPPQVITVSGAATPHLSNSYGSTVASFEELITGSPVSVSIVIQGCKVGGTCDTLDTYTTVANSIRKPTISTVYDYFVVTPTFSGGTNPSVTINAAASYGNYSSGGGGGGGSWGSITGTLSSQTDLQDALNLLAPIASPVFTGQPAIPDFTLATHNHSSAATGGNIPSSSVTGLAASATTDSTNASNIGSGTLPTGRLPALTGDVSSSAGSAATTIGTGKVTDDKASLLLKPSVGLVADSNLTLSGAQTVDGVLGSAGTTLVLATAQSTGSQNGPWIMQSGAWTRPTWYPAAGTSQALQFSTTFVRLGTLYSGTTWRMTTAGAVTIDSTSTAWAETPLALNATSLAGTLPAAQLPALTGDTTSSAGSAATTTKQAHWNETTITNASSPYTVLSTDSVITCNATAGAVVINLPAATGTGRYLTIKKTDSSANACTPTRAGSDLIDGATTYSLTVQYAASAIVDTASAVWSRTHVNQMAGDTSGVSTSNQTTVTHLSSPLPEAQGGTAANLSGTGGASQFLQQASVGAAVTVVRPACADLSNAAASCSTDATNATNISSGTLPAAQLPNPSASTLGGVQSKASVSNTFLTQISTSGVVSQAQPAVANLSDTPSAGQVLAGASAYGAAAAVGTYRALTAQDIPTGLTSCAILDNAICTSTVDGSGNPSYIAQGTTGSRLTITGTGWTGFIGGQYQTMTGTYTDAITGLGSSTFNYIYVKADVAAANIAAADFASTIVAPVYSYKTPTACTGATSSAPQYWFDLSANTWKKSTAAACSFSAASPQVIFIGAVWVTATPTISGIAHEPFRLNPYRRYEWFGDGFDAQSGQAGTDITRQTLTSGTTTLDNWHTYTSFQMTGATAKPTLINTSGATIGSLIVYSQNPVLVVNSSSLNATGLGRAGGAAATTTGNGGANSGVGGAGGGGGGAGATNLGGAGGGRTNFISINTQGGGGTAGAVAGTGGNATSTPTNLPTTFSYLACGGAAGGSGGGDGGAASGGAGGGGGGLLVIQAPSVVEDASSTIASDGGAPSNGAGTNGGGGGGGGGGCMIVRAGFYTLSGSFTANGSNGGTKAGTGGNGGNGSAGILQSIKLW